MILLSLNPDILIKFAEAVYCATVVNTLKISWAQKCLIIKM